MSCRRQFSRASRRRTKLTVIALATSVLGGCGDGHPPTYPVQGRVRFDDGRAVPVGVVEFRSESGGHIARGKIDQQGHFALGTFRRGDGAVEGLHHVIVVQHFDPILWQDGHLKEPPANLDGEHGDHDHDHHSHEPMFVDRRFAAYDTSGLKATVKPRSDNPVELVVGEPVKLDSAKSPH
jgi:hypothetical protein